MTVTITKNFGFIGVYNAVPSTSDWAVTYWNWLTLDEVLYGLVTHKHTGKPALQNPTGDLILTTKSSGGYLESDTTYYVVVTYVDELLKETAASTVKSITTGAGISRPVAPTINVDATPQDIQKVENGLTSGDYWYKISYVKDGGETLASLPVYVSIPFGSTYQCTFHFDSLNTVGNDADAIFVYRQSGYQGSYVKLAEITDKDTDSYTDDNTGIPICDKAPVLVSTVNSQHTITIDWSNLDYELATRVRIYATVTENEYPMNSLIQEVPIGGETPETSYEWLGMARTPGKPPEISHCFPSPSKVLLTDGAEVQGNLDWNNLPEDFNWIPPVDTFDDLPEGTEGDVCLVKDENKLYSYVEDWEELSGGGINSIETLDDLPLPSLYFHKDYEDLDATKGCNTSYSFADSFEGKGNCIYIFKFTHNFITSNMVTVQIHTDDDDGAPSSTILGSVDVLVDSPSDEIETDFDFGVLDLTDGDTYWVSLKYGANNGYLLCSVFGNSQERFGEGAWYDHAQALSFDLKVYNLPDSSIIYLNWDDKAFYYYNDTLFDWDKYLDPMLKQEAIADVEEDVTPTKEQLKINEILQALRDSGLIAS